MVHLVSLLSALLVLLASPAALAGDPAALCANPQAAAESLFVHLAAEAYDPAEAATCMEVPAGEEGGPLARELLAVLDARRLYVPVSELSTDPGFRNAEGKHLVHPMPDEAGWLSLTRGEDGHWRYTRSTVSQVPALYAETFSPMSRWLQASLPDAFYTVRPLGVLLWQVLYALALILAAWLAGAVVQRLIRSQLIRVIRKSGLDLDRDTWRRTSRPMVALAVGLVLLWGVPDLALSIKLSTAIYQVCWVLVALAAVLWLARLVDVFAKLADHWTDRTESRLDDQLVPMLRQGARVLIFMVGLVVILDTVGVDVWKLLAGVSIGGLAFALAAQDTVANLFGSLNIFVDKPFQIGDWVVIGKVEGTVEEVGFRSTRVRTFYNSVVTIPNSTITNADVDNMGRRHRRRVKMYLGLTYDTPPDKVQAFVEGVRAILAAHPYVQRTYEVHLHNLGASGLEILLYYHLVTPDWSSELEARSQNLLEFMRLAEELGVAFAFPSQSLYIESTPEHPAPAHPSPPIDELQGTLDSFGPDGANARPGGPPFSRSWTVAARTDRGSA